MFRSAKRCVRGWRPPFMRKNDEPVTITPLPSGAAAHTGLSRQHKERLRAMAESIVIKGSEKRMAHLSVGSSDVDELIDEDAIRARGVQKYKANYTPSADVESIAKAVIAHSLLESGEKVQEEQLSSFTFSGKNVLKFKVLSALESKMSGHYPLNGDLLYMKSVQDIINFYSTPVTNVSKYIEMAREERKPSNLTIIEHASRFHPEDVEQFHGGVTAFPGSGGEVHGLRNKRLLRQFKPKDKWFDYEDQAFDYRRPDEKMPWDREMVKKMDSFADKRYNLSTKTFTRTDRRGNQEYEA